MKTAMIIARAFLGAALVLGLFLGGCEGNVNDDTVPVLPIDLVSRSADGAPAKGSCYNPSISSDGTVVVFDSYSKMHPLDSNSDPDVYARDTVNGVTYLVSINAAGTGSGNSYSENPRISPDGRFVAFSSQASDLVAVGGFSDNNYNKDIYVHDLWTGRTLPVSVNALETGMAGVQYGTYPDVVSDSTDVYVVFETVGDAGFGTTMGTQIYLRQIPIASFEAAVLDLPQITNGITQLVSQNTGTAVSNGYNYNPVIALGDVAGSLVYVAWDSEATDLVASDTNGARDVFFRSVNRGTLALGGTVLVSKANGTVQGGNSDSSKPVLSEDAEYVAFVSAATNLLAPVPAPPDPPEDLNGKNDIYLRGALLSGPDSMERISEGGLGQANEDSYPAGLSADGRYVLFTSEASNLVEGDTNNVADIFMMDTATWTLSRASLTVFSGEPTEQSGATSLYDAGGADISGDGKSIVFQSSAQILPGVSLFEGRQIYRRKY